MPRQNQILWATGSAVQPSAGLHFLSFVSRRSLALRSAPSVNLACAALRGAYPQNRAVLASAPSGSAPLRRLTAPLCAPSLANYETNVFYWPVEAQEKGDLDTNARRTPN